MPLRNAPAHEEPASQLDRRCKSARVSATLAAAGGYLDAFTYVGHGHVFANAMTGNVVLLGVDAMAGSWRRSLSHLLPILMFLIGVAAARTTRLTGIRRWLLHPELAVLFLEILILFILGWLPQTISDFPITMSIAFAASLQMATFREIKGRTYSSTFTTGNLRTMIESGFDYLFLGRKRDHLTATGDFALICALFLLGATVGAFFTPKMFNHALWIDVAVLGAVFVWLLDAAFRPRWSPTS